MPTYESACEVREQPGLAYYSLNIKNANDIYAGYTNRTGLPMYGPGNGTIVVFFGLVHILNQLEIGSHQRIQQSKTGDPDYEHNTDKTPDEISLAWD